MHIKTIASAVALSAALGFGGIVYAQDAAATALPTMIGEQSLTEADAQRVKTFCDDLQTEASQAAGATDEEQELTDAQDGEATAMTSVDGADPEDTAEAGSVDLNTVTLEQCKEAGFVTTP